MPNELAAITFTLQPRKVNRIPEWQGRAAQALFYNSLSDIHPMIAETVHDLHEWYPKMPKPFTMSSLIGATVERDLIVLRPDQPLQLRMTTLHPQLTSICLNGVKPRWQAQGVHLHAQAFRVIRTQIIRTTYADLLDYAPDQDCITFHFAAPTAFNQTGKGYLAQPTPNYIFQSLYNRWNGLSSYPIPEAVLAVIDKGLRLVETDVQRKILSFARGKKGRIPGFQGRVMIAIHETSTELRRYLNALALYAEFGGVGIKTTVGMGQVRA